MYTVLYCTVLYHLLLSVVSTVQVIGVEEAMDRVRELKKLGPPKPVKGERARSKRRVPVVAIIGKRTRRLTTLALFCFVANSAGGATRWLGLLPFDVVRFSCGVIWLCS